MPDFDELLKEASQAQFSGWDFGFLKNRLVEQSLSWNYEQLARSYFQGARSLLDLDTGGGERLASLAPLPAFAVASESYLPNLRIAAARLRELKVHVIQVDPNVQNMHGPDDSRGFHRERALPFADASFDLILCRHGSFSAEEVARLLRPGGHLVAQLVEHDNYPHLNEWLQCPPTVWHEPDRPPPTLESGGLEIITRREEKPRAAFMDIAAAVYYLKAVPWQAPEFSIETHKEQLRRLHDHIVQNHGLRTHYHRRLIIASRPLPPESCSATASR